MSHATNAFERMVKRRSDAPTGPDMPTSFAVVAKRTSQTTGAHAAPATDRQTDHCSNRSQLSASAGTVNRIRNSTLAANRQRNHGNILMFAIERTVYQSTTEVVKKRKGEKKKWKLDMILTFPRHGEVHAKSDHAILSLEHSTALHHIYTQEHTSTHLHPSRTAFLPKSFVAAPVFPSLLCLFLSHHLCFPILPVSRCFGRLPLLVESLSLSHSPFLPLSFHPPPLYQTLSLSLTDRQETSSASLFSGTFSSSR